MGFGGDSAPIDPRVKPLVGAVDQLVSVDRLIRDEGPGRGAPILMVRNPRGVSFEVLLDRALDIGWADAPGMPLAWRSSRGPVSSSHYEPHGSGWTRTFGGGLLTTCGLASTGLPSEVNGLHHGLHGRVAHIAAENERWALAQVDGELCVEITGDVLEAALGVPPLRLRRRIVASTVAPRITVTDTVTNVGHRTAGHMFRHHLNMGYPMIQPGTVIDAAADLIGEREERDDSPEQLPWTLPEGAVVEDTESVLYFRNRSAPTTVVTLTTPQGSRCDIEYSNEACPYLLLWRDASPGVNVLGVEPSTSLDDGRASAEQTGDVIWLEPEESRSYTTEVRVSPVANWV